MRSKLSTRCVELNPGILELLYQKGYRYYVRIEITKMAPEDDCLMYFEVRFYKTQLEAEIAHSLIKAPNVFNGHILDKQAKELARGIPFCKFLLRDRGY